MPPVPHPLAACLALALGAPLHAANDYPLTPDSLPHEGVPSGRQIEAVYTAADTSVFPGTTRPYSLFIPSQYQPGQPACLLVVQDGQGRANEWRVPTVLNNLIHKGEMPVTIGVFVSPGVVPPAAGLDAQPRFNRSFEYDALGDRYVRFLNEEFLPWIARTHGLTFSTNAHHRAIAGASSGGIAAFNAAWERPDVFGRVFCTIGTFVGLRGGNDFPTLVRKTEPKPIRVFLQDGSNDLNIYGGNWWIANQDMLSALQFAGYDVQHAWGDGGHDGKHGAAILPDAMRWLWKDHDQPVPKPSGSRQPLASILIPGEDWRLVSSGHGFTEGPAVNAHGEVFFSDIPGNRIHRIRPDGTVVVFAENAPGVNGLCFGADGYLYACENGARRISRYAPDGSRETFLDQVSCNDLVAVGSSGGYITDPENRKVWFTDGSPTPLPVDEGIAFPNGVVASPDHAQVYVADTRGGVVYSYLAQSDGRLAHREPFFHLHTPDSGRESGADGMTVDTEGRLYVTTSMGIQVCDQPGRVNGIISKPRRAWLSNVVFGGPNLDILYATCGDSVFARKTRVRGIHPSGDPVKPPTPRL